MTVAPPSPEPTERLSAPGPVASSRACSIQATAASSASGSDDFDDHLDRRAFDVELRVRAHEDARVAVAHRLEDADDLRLGRLVDAPPRRDRLLRLQLVRRRFRTSPSSPTVVRAGRTRSRRRSRGAAERVLERASAGGEVCPARCVLGSDGKRERRRSARSITSSCGASNAAAIASRVTSSGVPPSPPVTITKSAFADSARTNSAIRSISSGSDAISVTVTPSSSSCCASHAAFVLTVSPERSSLPIVMIEAVTRPAMRPTLTKRERFPGERQAGPAT